MQKMYLNLNFLMVLYAGMAEKVLWVVRAGQKLHKKQPTIYKRSTKSKLRIFLLDSF